jgi:N-glycosylase/DNA lyase
VTTPFIKSSFSSAGTCADAATASRIFLVHDYDLAATLNSGQTFRWQLREGWWEGVIGLRWVRLRAEAVSRTSEKAAENESSVIIAEAAEPVNDWRWLADYLQVGLNLADILGAFPDDQPMRLAVAACRGLRLLRQDPWECLASFILSSSKRIVQIQQIVARLCEKFGEQVMIPQNHQPVYSFPLPGRLAAAGESELRACKMGFRAPNLRAAAQVIAGGTVNLGRLSALPIGEARDALMRLPGVGRKIADCVLLFAYGHQDAFPVDVWVMKALRRLYFPRRQASLKRLHKFAATHFGPYAGYAQQYLFHYARVHAKLND